MKIAALSDIHEDEFFVKILKKNKEEYDLILFAGDLTHIGNPARIKYFMKKLNDIGKKVIFIPGNHDFYFEKEENIEELKKEFQNIEILINEYTEYKGLKIYGCPMSLRFFNWAFMCSEEQIKNFLPDKYVDILLIHQPPMHDKLSKFYNFYSGNVNNPGSLSINEYITEFKPKYVICGHIHENGRNVANIENTKCINVAQSINYIEINSH